jgi:uncharacterized protein involved in cysteine biosynthesis
MVSCLLLPYLISSTYSIVAAVLQMPAAPNWLWGDWLNTIVGESRPLYMLLAEGPICCLGATGLLIVILGLALILTRVGQGEAAVFDEEVAEPEEWQDEDMSF